MYARMLESKDAVRQENITSKRKQLNCRKAKKQIGRKLAAKNARKHESKNRRQTMKREIKEVSRQVARVFISNEA